ncbi:MAG: hypothetical protein FD123_1866 [Bacteroidetes bacterium]|nr:MAG: hypothetical protein FD123_1866 [Bacteroidota bacterium]
MIEVFKTNVSEPGQAQLIAGKLQERFPAYRVHFDLEDCDKILRIETTGINADEIISILHASGFRCEVLPG